MNRKTIKVRDMQKLLIKLGYHESKHVKSSHKKYKKDGVSRHIALKIGKKDGYKMMYKRLLNEIAEDNELSVDSLLEMM